MEGLYTAASKMGRYKKLKPNKHGLIAETFGEGFKMFREGLHLFRGKGRRRDE